LNGWLDMKAYFRLASGRILLHLLEARLEIEGCFLHFIPDNMRIILTYNYLGF